MSRRGGIMDIRDSRATLDKGQATRSNNQGPASGHVSPALSAIASYIYETKRWDLSLLVIKQEPLSADSER